MKKFTYSKVISLFTIMAALTVQPMASFAQTADGTVTIATSMKWYPGNYIMNNLDAKETEVLLSDFANIPSMRGIQKMYYWSELEPIRGNYSGFAAIDRDLALAKKYGKKLSITIGYKYKASPTKSSLPNYVLNLKNATVNGLSVPAYFLQDKALDDKWLGGHHANFGHPATMNAFNNLLKALAAKYDKDTGVSYIQFSETSISAQTTPELETNFLNGIITMNQKARVLFVKTPLIQSLNYPRSRLADFVNNITANKMGFGGPDLFFGAFDDPKDGLTVLGTKYTAQGVYRYTMANNGNLPIGMQAHRNNLFYASSALMQAKQPHNLPPAESIVKVHDLANNKLFSNYIAWHVFGAGDPYRIALKGLLKANDLPVVTKCPTVYNNTCQTQ